MLVCMCCKCALQRIWRKNKLNFSTFCALCSVLRILFPVRCLIDGFSVDSPLIEWNSEANILQNTHWIAAHRHRIHHYTRTNSCQKSFTIHSTIGIPFNHRIVLMESHCYIWTLNTMGVAFLDCNRKCINFNARISSFIQLWTTFIWKIDGRVGYLCC